MAYVSKTDEELEQLAQDIMNGKVFHSGMLQSLRDLSSVFLPLTFLDNAALETMKADKISFFYEYYSKIFSNMSVNGNPNFGSVSFLNAEDHQILAKKVKEIEDFFTARKK